MSYIFFIFLCFLISLSAVSQEPTLFDMTIAENIRFGKWDATEEEVILAAKKVAFVFLLFVALHFILFFSLQANAHAFIEKLPNGYETICGSGGHLLSGGQKQRIAIARAVLKVLPGFVWDAMRE